MINRRGFFGGLTGMIGACFVGTIAKKEKGKITCMDDIILDGAVNYTTEWIDVTTFSDTTRKYMKLK